MLLWIWNRNSYALLMRMQTVTAALQDSLAVFHRLNTIFPYNQVIVLLDAQMSWKHMHTKSFTSMFIEVLFMISQNWEPSKCPSLGEWINCNTFIQCNIIVMREKEFMKKTYTKLKFMLLIQGVSLKGLHIIWCYCVTSLKGQTTEVVKDWWLLGVRSGTEGKKVELQGFLGLWSNHI